MVVIGMIPTEVGRIPLSDGAGEVMAVGAGVTEFSVGDQVMSAFISGWTDGLPPRQGAGLIPCDSCDGYACEVVTASAGAFTAAPAGYSPAEAATLSAA
jgi:NADPH:quinone reductase-like Zn-dependent oxidoreductase